ncbi:hypothetical protein [Leptospira biflexa]|uniref:hypothetical protein n=1 Tax=Leptospira biflexa TaxID=172 RepID=UPI0002D3B3BC|nr:hypothetical protein [Leptospira biflexa]
MEPYMENAEIEKTQEDEKFTKIKALAKEAYRFLDQGRFKEAKERLDILLDEDPSLLHHVRIYSKH